MVWNVTSCASSARRLLRRLVRDESGFTLTELLTSVTILGIVVAGLVTLFTSGMNAEAELNRRFQAQTTARTALDGFRKEVHNACSATVSGGTTVTLKVPDGTNPLFDYPCTVTASTWCTVGSGTRFALYRATGGTCSSSGIQRADFLTSGAIFSTISSVGRLPRIGVDMTVNVRPDDPRVAYRLDDQIALRNVRRT